MNGRTLSIKHYRSCSDYSSDFSSKSFFENYIQYIQTSGLNLISSNVDSITFPEISRIMTEHSSSFNSFGFFHEASDISLGSGIRVAPHSMAKEIRHVHLFLHSAHQF